jgi:transcriptional regulator with GAF, ATPase, and Fis domain
MKQGGETHSIHCEVAIDDQTYGETVYLSKELNVVRIYAQNITHLKHAEAILKLSQGELELLVRERTAELHRVNEHLVQEVAQHKQADSEIQRLKEKIREENIYLRKEVSLLHSHKEIIGNSEAIRHVLKRVEQVASVGSTVLIQGETGTGKELIAHSIHNLSSRKGRLMIKVNCAALPPTLIESELFGREKGAYTGALSKQIGRFELADDSTIFLDEVDSLPLELQAKLLRVLESGEFERLGSPRTVKVNVRIIAATNSNLADVVVDGRFREDLYYRLNVFLIQVPPLRERREDIAPLLWFFVKEFCEKMGKRIESIPLRYVQAMQAYTWPGNIREMRNVIERAMIIATGSSLPLEVPKASQTQKNLRTLQDVEKKYIIEVLDTSGWRVSGKGGAAEILGINPKTLESRIKKMGIQRNKNNT